MVSVCGSIHNTVKVLTILFKYIDQVASFPGPAQLSVAISTLFRTASDEKLGGAWERGYRSRSRVNNYKIADLYTSITRSNSGLTVESSQASMYIRSVSTSRVFFFSSLLMRVCPGGTEGSGRVASLSSSSRCHSA